MSEMVERVAKAKWARRQQVARDHGITPPLDDWAIETEALREEVRAEVRCGLEAMREPTDDMAEAIWAETADPCWKENAIQAWQAGIDTALSKPRS